ncbi:MAG: AraC family transcriptional regulator [Bacteroidales bacterium]|nr:AraC family transcriptional regulator [Bacteroidales bacterium]
MIYEKRLFQKQHFCKDDLAIELGSNRTYIGEALSTCRNCRWNEYVNSFRLRFFLETARLKENRHVTVEDMAVRCGFGSAYTLNKHLKREYGTTASAYRKNLSTSLRAAGKANTATRS